MRLTSRSLGLMVLLVVEGSAIPAPLRCIRATAAPAIDGKLDDAVWKQASWNGGLTRLGSGAPEEVATRFALSCDDANLYLAVVCSEPQMERRVARSTRRDDLKLYGDDEIEWFLAPGGQRVDYYQIQVNSLGTVADTAGHQSGIVRDAHWNCSVKVAVQTMEAAWQVEMALPLASLELGGAGARDWGVNLVRVRRAGGREELATFCPMTASFHQPGLFASFSMDGFQPEPFRWNLFPPTGLRVIQDGSSLLLSGTWTLQNDTGLIRPVLVFKYLVRDDGHSPVETRSDVWDVGQTKTAALSLPLSVQGPQELVVEIRDRRDTNRLYAERRWRVDPRFQAMAMELSEPCFHDCFFASQNPTSIQGKIRFALPLDTLKACTLRLGFSAENGPGRELGRGEWVAPSEKQSFTVPIPSLEEGRYLLTATLVDAQGQTLHEMRRTLRKLPPPPGGVEWRIDARGVLLRNGVPFMPLGWYGQPASNAALHGARHNVTVTYGGPWWSDEKLIAYLDDMHKAGVAVWLYPYIKSEQAEVLNKPLTQTNASLIRARVARMKTHPALLGWYLGDEPEYHGILPESMAALRRHLAEEDPWHPTLVVNNTLQAIDTYSVGADILAPDPYPFFKRGGISPALGKVAPFVADARRACSPGQAAWVVAQAYDSTDFGGKGERAPKFIESRNMAWQALAGGATGLLWWAWDWAYPNSVDVVLGNAYLAREIEALKPYLLDGAPERIDRLDKAGKGWVEMRRKAGDQELLAIVNTESERRTIRVLLPGLGGKTLCVLGEGRDVVIPADGVLSDPIDGFGTHVYLTDRGFGKFEALAQVQASIDRSNALRKRPGNLAFEDSGLRLSVSSTGRYAPGPVWMVDGFREGKAWRSGKWKGEEWVEMKWPAPIALSRLVIHHDGLREVEVMIPPVGAGNGEAWERIGSSMALSNAESEIRFPPVRSDQLRLRITGLRPGAEAARIYELEVYEK